MKRRPWVSRAMKRRVARYRASQAIIVLDGTVTVVRVTGDGRIVHAGKVWPRVRRKKQSATHWLGRGIGTDAPKFKGIPFEYVEALETAAMYAE